MSWSRVWSWASFGSTSRAAQALQRLTAAPAPHRALCPRHAFFVRRSEPGDVDRRPCIEDQCGIAGRVLPAVGEEPLDAGRVGGRIAARECRDVYASEAVPFCVELPGRDGAPFHLPDVSD